MNRRTYIGALLASVLVIGITYFGTPPTSTSSISSEDGSLETLPSEVSKSSAQVTPSMLQADSNEVPKESFLKPLNQVPAPIDQYRNHIESAKAGDSQSQFIVASALSTCVDSVSSLAQLEEIRATSGLSEKAVSNLEQRFLECEDFHKVVKDLRTARDTWVESAASQGSDIAILYRDVFQTGTEEPLSKEEFRSRLIPSLENGLESPEVMDDALQFVSIFFARHAEWRHMEWAAWNVLYCRASTVCKEENVMLYEITSVYKPAEIEEIKNMVASYSKAIEERNWPALELDHP